MKTNILVIILAAFILVSCGGNSQQKAIRQMCETIHQQYPKANLQDIYKTCYQDFFGAEHLLNDTAAARQYLHQELEECRHTDLSAMPLKEPTGFRHHYTRINLACVHNGMMTEEQLMSQFAEAAAQPSPTPSNWSTEWEQIEKIALQVNPAWADTTLQAELRQAAKEQQAVRHSETFRNTYHPHYRIVKNH